MGQYYVVANLDKKQYLNPHRFGEGIKLLEFGADAGGTMTGLAILLASSNGRGGGDLRSDSPVVGTWAGDRIVIGGDYAEPGDPGEPAVGEAAPITYEAAYGEGSDWEDVSDKVIAALLDDRYLKQDFIRQMTFRLRYDPEGRGEKYAGISKLLWPGLYEEAKALKEKEGAEPEPQGSLRPDIVIGSIG